MSLLMQIKTRVIQAMKAGDTLTRDVLRVAQGDIEMGETRQGRALTEQEAQQIVRKLIKSDQETLALTQDAGKIADLQKEIAILEALLPRTLSVAEIIAALEPVADDVRAAGNDGQATGVAMKHLKPQGLAVEGKDVTDAVKQLRSV